MDEFTARILRVLVEGHQARAGMKDRNRALTEYEIARRAGYTEFSYVEFSTTRERDQVRGALDELERSGWVSQWDRAGRYDTFVPTELGVRRANTFDIVQDGPSGSAASDRVPATPADAPCGFPRNGGEPDRFVPPSVGEGAARESGSGTAAALQRLVQQMDEVLVLLRAIDAKLGRDG
jgi:hypothetical protein